MQSNILNTQPITNGDTEHFDFSGCMRADPHFGNGSASANVSKSQLFVGLWLRATVTSITKYGESKRHVASE